MPIGVPISGGYKEIANILKAFLKCEIFITGVVNEMIYSLCVNVKIDELD